MSALAPWSIARRAAPGRHAVLLVLLAALLYGFGIHAARACAHDPAAAMPTATLSADAPCHHGDIDVAEAACEAHCRADTQSGRVSVSFDLPAAAPPGTAPVLAPPATVGLLALDASPPRGDTGPPLHILLHRLLR